MGQREDKKGKGKKSPLYISDKEYGVDVGDPESSFRSIVGESSSSALDGQLGRTRDCSLTQTVISKLPLQTA